MQNHWSLSVTERCQIVDCVVFIMKIRTGMSTPYLWQIACPRHCLLVPLSVRNHCEFGRGGLSNLLDQVGKVAWPSSTQPPPLNHHIVRIAKGHLLDKCHSLHPSDRRPLRRHSGVQRDPWLRVQDVGNSWWQEVQVGAQRKEPGLVGAP